MGGGSTEGSALSLLMGRSKRGRLVGDWELRPSTEASGISGPVLSEGWVIKCLGDNLLFFVEDVVNASCPCSSVFADGSKVVGS